MCVSQMMREVLYIADNRVRAISRSHPIRRMENERKKIKNSFTIVSYFDLHLEERDASSSFVVVVVSNVGAGD